MEGGLGRASVERGIEIGVECGHWETGIWRCPVTEMWLKTSLFWKHRLFFFWKKFLPWHTSWPQTCNPSASVSQVLMLSAFLGTCPYTNSKAGNLNQTWPIIVSQAVSLFWILSWLYIHCYQTLTSVFTSVTRVLLSLVLNTLPSIQNLFPHPWESLQSYKCKYPYKLCCYGHLSIQHSSKKHLQP